MSLQPLPPITEQGLQREEEVQESVEGRVVDEQRALDPLRGAMRALVEIGNRRRSEREQLLALHLLEALRQQPGLEARVVGTVPALPTLVERKAAVQPKAKLSLVVEVHPPHSEPELAQLEAHLGTGPVGHPVAVRPRDLDDGDRADRRIEEEPRRLRLGKLTRSVSSTADPALHERAR